MLSSLWYSFLFAEGKKLNVSVGESRGLWVTRGGIWKACNVLKLVSVMQATQSFIRETHGQA
jgi:hypothetical protein